jgi:hypothetical protein
LIRKEDWYQNKGGHNRLSSTFYFDDDGDDWLEPEQQERKWGLKRRPAESYEVSNTLLSYQPTNAIDPAEEASYHKYMRETQYQPLPPPQIKDPATGQDVIIASRDFQVSLIGEDGPDEYLSVSRAADRLTTVWEDAADIRYKLDQQYYTGAGGGYQPINFGIPKYTGDAGYPIVDPNPGNCKPGFLKDQFGRCLHTSWFNLPFAPAGNPWVDVSGNSVITNGMSPINGVCPNDMFLASNNKCYFFPAPPQTLPPPPPPPATVSGGTPVSGSSSYASAYYGNLGGRLNNTQLFGKSPSGRVYNTPPQVSQSFYGNNTVQVDYPDGDIKQVYVERKFLSPGDRVVLHTIVELFEQSGSGFHLGITVPDLNFKVSTPEIPVRQPGLSEEVQTDFLIPIGTEPGDYVGEIQLVKGTRKIDSVNFLISVE